MRVAEALQARGAVERHAGRVVVTIELPEGLLDREQLRDGIVVSVLECGDREALERIVDALAEAPDETRVVTGTALAAVAALEGRHDADATQLLAVEQTLRKLDRHYDAACVALDGAASLERLGDERGAGEGRDRANALLVPLGCRYPY